MKTQIVLLLCAFIVSVAGHGWLIYPEPRGFAAPETNQTSASTTSPCGRDGSFKLTATLDNYGTLTVKYSIGGGHFTGNGPNTCRFAVANTSDDAAAFDNNVVASGIPCLNSGIFTRNISVFTPTPGLNYLQFLWQPGDGGKWYGCSLIDINPTNLTVYDVTGSVTTPITAGAVDFYRTSIPADYNLHIVASGPTDAGQAVTLYADRNSLASSTNYDRMLMLNSQTTASTTLCGGKGDSTAYITVSCESANSGTYSFTATPYNAQADYTQPTPQISDQLTFSGSKIYWTEAFSTEEVPKRIVVTAPAGTTLSQSTQCTPKTTPDATVATGSTSVCLDLSKSQNRKYLEVTSSTPIAFTLGLEKGSCAEYTDNSAVHASVSMILLIAVLSILFIAF